MHHIPWALSAVLNLVHNRGFHIGDGSNAQIGDLVDYLTWNILVTLPHPTMPRLSILYYFSQIY